MSALSVGVHLCNPDTQIVVKRYVNSEFATLEIKNNGEIAVFETVIYLQTKSEIQSLIDALTDASLNLPDSRYGATNPHYVGARNV